MLSPVEDEQEPSSGVKPELSYLILTCSSAIRITSLHPRRHLTNLPIWSSIDSRTAAAQLALGRPGDARELVERVSIQENLIKAKPADTNYRNGLAESLLRSGKVRRATGDAVGAAADWRRAIALYAGLPPHLRDEPVLEAGCHAMLSGLAGLAGSSITASDGAIEAERAMDILRGLFGTSYRGQGPRTEPALDPLRSRPEFQLLMMDLAFASDPLAN